MKQAFGAFAIVVLVCQSLCERPRHRMAQNTLYVVAKLTLYSRNKLPVVYQSVAVNNDTLDRKIWSYQNCWRRTGVTSHYIYFWCFCDISCHLENPNMTSRSKWLGWQRNIRNNPWKLYPFHLYRIQDSANANSLQEARPMTIRYFRFSVCFLYFV